MTPHLPTDIYPGIPFQMVNGHLVATHAASVSAFDIGLLRGYGIFDFFPVWNGIPFFIDHYLDRFQASAAALHLQAPDSASIRQQVADLIAANELQNAGIRLVLTGGMAEDGYTPILPHTFLALASPMAAPEAPLTQNGIRLLSMPYQRFMPEVKTLNYLPGISLLPQLRAAGAHEPLFHTGTHVLETVRSNVFMVMPDGRILTPDTGILKGVTRKLVLNYVAEKYPVEERPVLLTELFEAAEVFITGSGKRILPVVKVDNTSFGDGKPGRVTKEIMDWFNSQIEASKFSSETRNL